MNGKEHTFEDTLEEIHRDLNTREEEATRKQHVKEAVDRIKKVQGVVSIMKWASVEMSILGEAALFYQLKPELRPTRNEIREELKRV